MRQITYGEWRKNNNPYVNFTGNPFVDIGESGLQFIYTIIDNHFLSRHLGAEPELFARYFINTLLKNQFWFFAEFAFTFNANFEMFNNILSNKQLKEFNAKSSSSLTEKSDLISLSENKTTADSVTTGSSTDTSTQNNNSNREITSTDRATQNDDARTTSTDTARARNLLSTTPNSIISENSLSDLDTSINWKYATSLSDDVSKTNGDTNTNSTSERTNNNNSRDIESGNTTINSESNASNKLNANTTENKIKVDDNKKDSEKNTTNKYNQVLTRFNSSDYNKLIEVFYKQSNIFDRLLKKLEKHFDWRFEIDYTFYGDL